MCLVIAQMCPDSDRRTTHQNLLRFDLHGFVRLLYRNCSEQKKLPGGSIPAASTIFEECNSLVLLADAFLSSELTAKSVTSVIR